MTVSVATWNLYAQLLRRLNPRLDRIAFADSAAIVQWSSNVDAAAQLQPVLAQLAGEFPRREASIDGASGASGDGAPSYGFRVRSALGEVLCFVLVAQPLDRGPPADLGAIYGLVSPALDCLQSELSASATGATRELDLLRQVSEVSPADGHAALGRIPDLALEHLQGLVAAVLLPAREITVSRMRAGQVRSVETAVLAQMHRHLMTRAQLHDRTLVAHRVYLETAAEALPYKVVSTPVRDDARRVVGVLAVFRDGVAPDFERRDTDALETLARRATQILEASFDAITGLLTQAAFVAQVQTRLSVQDQQRTQEKHALLYADIDQLNLINDAHGMHVGDDVIRSIAALFARRVREGSLVARVGGDRFAAFVPGSGIEPAARIAEELRAAALKLSAVRNERPLPVSLSVGVAGIGSSEQRLGHAIAAAEFACRTAKERGRNRVEIYYGTAGVPGLGRAALSLAAQATAALVAESLELLAQPVLPLGPTPAEPRFEVLLRLRAEDGTRLSMDKLSQAPDCEPLMRAIDRWVVSKAVERLMAYRDVLREHPAKFSVNLSAASLQDEPFWHYLEDAVRTARIETGTLGFEFSEAAAHAHGAFAAPQLRRLRELGVSFAMDHFAGGVASLSELASVPVSCIKLDGAYSRDVLDNPKSQSALLAMAQLAKNSGLETVASHIETDAIRARVASLGIDYGQGFFIGKPLPLDDVLRDLPLYSCFATSTGLFDTAFGAVGTNPR